MSAASTIRDARELIAPKGKWTQEAIARDVHGNEVKPHNPVADRFCIVGALQRVCRTTDEYSSAIFLIRKHCGDKSIMEFNDSHGKRSILAVLDKAAKSAEVAA